MYMYHSKYIANRVGRTELSYIVHAFSGVWNLYKFTVVIGTMKVTECH